MKCFICLFTRSAVDPTDIHSAKFMLKEAEMKPGYRLSTLLDNAIAAIDAIETVVIFTQECKKMLI